MSKKTFHRFIHSAYTHSILLLLLFCLYFKSTLLWIVENFTDPTFYEYGVFFVIVLILLAVIFYQKRKVLKKQWRFSFYLTPFIGLGLMLGSDVINAVFFHYNILSGLFFFLGFYFLLGFYLPQNLWRRGVFFVGIIALTLPFIEHIQNFLGFPIRMATAKLVSLVLSALGYMNVTESTIIFTENTATSIDLPCSGVKSIYIGTLLMLIIYYLKKVQFSWNLLWGSIVFYFLLFFFNFWRVFSLIFIVDILGMREQGDAIHVFLGVIGFGMSVLFLWYFSERFLGSEKEFQPLPQKDGGKQKNYLWVWVLMILFLLLDVGSGVYFKFKPAPNRQETTMYDFDFSEENFEKIPFTQKEIDFFDSRELQFAQKYRGKVGQLPYAMLILTSRSWRTHHNPELCAEGMGYTVDHSKIVQVNGAEVREVILEKGEGVIFYWFVGRDEIISDYSQRVWRGMMDPSEPWSLVVLKVEKPEDVRQPGFIQLMGRVNEELSEGIKD